MNVFNKVLLSIVLSPKGLYRSLGIDMKQLKSILNIKLIMDDRRPNTFQLTSHRKKNKPVSFATIGTMVLSLLLGLVYLFAFAIGRNMLTQLTIYFSFFFFMLSATLISDFTSVLIDVRDTFIILPKPVSDKTMISARLLHIFIHICKIVLPMSVPGVVMTVVNYGLGGGILLLIIAIFVTLFAIFFINALYILILKITTPQKFQSIISYIQIVFAIIIYASYQLVPRMADSMHLQEFDITSKAWVYFYPIFWFSSLWQSIMNFSSTTHIWFAAIGGLLLPFVSIWIVVKYLAPTFNNKLALISSSSETISDTHKVKTAKQKARNYSDWLGKMFTKGFTERMGFLFTWRMTARSRDFKMKVYPSIGYLVVWVFLIFFNNKHMSLDQIRSQGEQGRIMIISALYFTSFLLTMSLNQMIYSEKYKASWIFYVTPIQRPGEVILGAAKAAVMKFYIPIVVLLTVTGLILAGPLIIPNLILGLLNQLLIAFVLIYSGNKAFPFSLHQNTNVKAGSFIRNLSIMLFSGLIGVGHYMIYHFTAALILCIFLSFFALWYITGSIRNISWAAIKNAYEE